MPTWSCRGVKTAPTQSRSPSGAKVQGPVPAHPDRVQRTNAGCGTGKSGSASFSRSTSCAPGSGDAVTVTGVGGDEHLARRPVIDDVEKVAGAHRRSVLRHIDPSLPGRPEAQRQRVGRRSLGIDGLRHTDAAEQQASQQQHDDRMLARMPRCAISAQRPILTAMVRSARQCQRRRAPGAWRRRVSAPWERAASRASGPRAGSSAWWRALARCAGGGGLRTPGGRRRASRRRLDGRRCVA